MWIQQAQARMPVAAGTERPSTEKPRTQEMGSRRRIIID